MYTGYVGYSHLLVISKVVPKIWARTNSAIMDGGVGVLRQWCWGWRVRGGLWFVVGGLAALSRFAR